MPTVELGCPTYIRIAISAPVSPENHNAPDLKSKIIEATPRGSQQKLLIELCAILDISQQDAIDRYSSQVIRTLRKAKVHAEIQLIAHCELENPELSPRVICSSKDACFLCNLCLQLYQKIYTPRSHGRLYPGWRLPCLPQLAELQQRVSQTLGNHFKETCATLLSTRRKSIYPDPNESTLFTLPLSRTTTKDSILSRATKTGSRIIPLPKASNVNLDIDTSHPRTETADSENLDMLPDSPISSQYRASSIEKQLEYCTLVQGSKEHGCLTPGESSKVYGAGSPRSIQIHIEHATGSNNLAYHLEWLGVEEAVQVWEKGSSTHVIDVEHLEGTTTLHEQSSLYIIAKGTVLKIGWVSEHDSLS